MKLTSRYGGFARKSEVPARPADARESLNSRVRAVYARPPLPPTIFVAMFILLAAFCFFKMIL